MRVLDTINVETFTSLSSGKVGVSINAKWYEPLDNREVNIAARDRALQFFVSRDWTVLFFNELYNTNQQTSPKISRWAHLHILSSVSREIIQT